MDYYNYNKRAHDTGSSHLFIFMCFALLYFEVGELVCECVPTWPSGQNWRQIWGPLVLLFDWKLASSLDLNLQCLWNRNDWELLVDSSC